MLPDIDEIVHEVHEHTEGDIPPTYQEYLERIKKDYLERSQALDFLVKVGISTSANIANAATVLIACELGIGWFSAASLGFGFGLIPVAYYLNKAGLNFNEGVNVREPGALLTAGGLLIGGGAVAWNFAGEKRLLIQYADEGRKQSAKIIAEYEVKPQPLNKLFDSVIETLGGFGNVVIALLVCFVFWKMMRRH